MPVVFPSPLNALSSPIHLVEVGLFTVSEVETADCVHIQFRRSLMSHEHDVIVLFNGARVSNPMFRDLWPVPALIGFFGTLRMQYVMATSLPVRNPVLAEGPSSLSSGEVQSPASLCRTRETRIASLRTGDGSPIRCLDHELDNGQVDFGPGRITFAEFTQRRMNKAPPPCPMITGPAGENDCVPHGNATNTKHPPSGLPPTRIRTQKLTGISPSFRDHLKLAV